VLPLCRELAIGFVPYSPLGRGLLTGTIRDRATLGSEDLRRNLPRFEEANMASNLALLEPLTRIAQGKGVSTGQLALAWVLHQGDFIVPIPGARKIKHLEENTAAAAIQLSSAELAMIEQAMPRNAVRGNRSRDANLKLVNR
jgi:aryl-alcohol dehydrogenase-like predicted oxidoreductase